MSKLCLYLTFAIVLCLFTANSSAKPNPTKIDIIVNTMAKPKPGGIQKYAPVKGTHLTLVS